MDVQIESSWKHLLENEFEKEYFKNLTEFVRGEYRNENIFPPAKLIFSAFDHCPFETLKVVILGQDPYHGPGQANGLCFSVNDGLRLPPSLVNIFTEIKNDTEISIPESGNLERWADQGVLLLNSTLTVKAHNAGSHQNKGWETFTDSVIKIISDQQEHVVFLLWGAYAHRKGEVIDKTRHTILQCPHPSPFSVHRGFSGCKHFSRANTYLIENGKTPISW